MLKDTIFLSLWKTLLLPRVAFKGIPDNLDVDKDEALSEVIDQKV